jgi:hypothetical protein
VNLIRQYSLIRAGCRKIRVLCFNQNCQEVARLLRQWEQVTMLYLHKQARKKLRLSAQKNQQPDKPAVISYFMAENKRVSA